MNPRASIPAWRVYLVTDSGLSLGRPLETVVRAALEAGIHAVQYREKHAPSKVLYEEALRLRALCRAAEVPFLVNDRLDIALAVDADGLHVGQDDLPAAAARKWLGPDRILGVSAATPAEARAAARDGADYLGVAPIYEARATKPDVGEPVGVERLRAVRAACALPLIGIGGIKADNAAAVIEAGACGVAVVSAVMAAPDVAAAVRDLLRATAIRRG